MATYQIIDRNGEALNTVEASADFMAAHYPPMPIIADNNEGPDEFWPQYREVVVAIVPAPVVVSMHKAREILIRNGVMPETVQAVIDSIPDAVERALAENSWLFSPTVSSDSALVASIGQALGLDIESLFQQAGGV